MAARFREVPFKVWLRTNWRALISLLSLVISGILSSIPPLQPYAMAPLSAAIASLVLMVWHLEKEESPIRTYRDMQEASKDLEGEIVRAAGESSSPLVVQIAGCRLRDIRSMLNRIAMRVPASVRFEIYHIAPSFLRTEPWAMASHEVPALESAIEEIERILGQNRVSFFEYFHPPIFYAYYIESRVLFYGNFQWEADGNTWGGPKNPCLRVRKADAIFNHISLWVSNRLKFWREGSGSGAAQPHASTGQ
jgi:hypothetical protein